jgi:hyaluronate lyase
VSVDLQQVTRSRRVVRTSNPDTAVTKQVFGLTVAQPAGSQRSTAYALVPNATESELRSYQHGRLSVLANTPRLQAIQHLGLGLTGANSFGPLKAEDPDVQVVRTATGTRLTFTTRHTHGRSLTVKLLPAW